MDKLKWGLALQAFLLLMSWIGDDAATAAAADSSLEEYLVDKENKVRLLASDALRLALDREDCVLNLLEKKLKVLFFPFTRSIL